MQLQFSKNGLILSFATTNNNEIGNITPDQNLAKELCILFEENEVSFSCTSFCGSTFLTSDISIEATQLTENMTIISEILGKKIGRHSSRDAMKLFSPSFEESASREGLYILPIHEKILDETSFAKKEVDRKNDNTCCILQ